LTEREITCLLKLLAKEGSINVDEFIQIMENFGIYENQAHIGQPETEEVDEYSLNGETPISPSPGSLSKP